MNEDFQHHYFSIAHYPLVYTPLIFFFILSLIFDFYPIYFLTPVIGIYLGHFLFDTIACGDGVMWGKNPFRRNRYTRFVNIWYKKTDGYHGFYWEARYRQTIIGKIGNIAVMISAMFMQIFHIHETFRIFPFPTFNLFYLFPLIYFLSLLYFGLRKGPEEFLNEPPKGRYADYRVDPNYIRGLSEKNRKKHLEKYAYLINK